MTSNSANRGGSVGANTLYGPSSVYFDGAKLYIADVGNNRILIYNTIPTTNGVSADVVIGQANMTSSSSNRGGSVAVNTLASPSSVYSDGTKLYITDQYNNRVLIYNSIPIIDGVSANVVIGQTNFTSRGANRGANYYTSGTVGVNTLYYPNSVCSDGTKLYIADNTNHRVLIYNHIPTESDHSADVVIGQASFLVRSANRGGSVGDNTLSSPYSVYSDGTRLFISDYSNNRTLIYNTIPTTDGVSADVVIGQTNFTSSSANKGSTVSASSINYPTGVFSDGTHLFISDSYNNRILIYPLGPLSSTAVSPVNVVPSEITISLNASADTKDFIISEDQNFTGAS